MTRFMQRYAPDCDPLSALGYAHLHAWSVREPDAFWRAIWEFCSVLGKPGSDVSIPGKTLLDWKWFPQAELSFAENLLQPQRLEDPAFASSLACIACDERGNLQPWTRAAWVSRVIAVARYFSHLGIEPGDRIAAVIPNNACACIAYLATASLGAIWSSCSPDFGVDAIADRFEQIEPKLLITSLRTQYNGKPVQPAARVCEVLPRLPSVRHVLVDGVESELDLERLERGGGTADWIAWEEALRERDTTAWQWPRFPFDHPLCIVYSSGTTGVPKCIVHSVGGTLLQHLKEHQLHCDLQATDRMMYYTTTGWMMWNWLVSGLASQATIVTYDGSPVAPEPDALWRIASEHRLTHFGASARYYAMLEKSGVEPKALGSLEALRCVLSTGSPLLPESFDWVYRSIRPDVNLASISGGTDILSCFVLGNPNLPVHRGEIQCKGLGMDVQVLDAEQKRAIDVPGELVCANAFPSMPIGFWNDPDRTRYRHSYFETIPGVWCHGDWAKETERGGFIIYGRSDATLNPGGVRIGTAEIYQQIETFPEVAEAIATALKSDGDEKIVLFVRLTPGHELTPELAEAMRAGLRQRCSPRHVPAIIDAAPDLPRTISGKLSEIAVRNAICGMELGNAGALANPESLDYFRTWRFWNPEVIALSAPEHKWGQKAP